MRGEKYIDLFAEQTYFKTPPTIHTIVSSVKLYWNLGITNFIVRLYKLNTLSLLSAVTANSNGLLKNVI